MDEMIILDGKGGLQNYKDYLYSFLMTQYGLAKIASNYCSQIIERVKEFAKDGHNQYAVFLLHLL